MHGHLFIAIACALAVLAVGCIAPAWAMKKNPDGSRRRNDLNYLIVAGVALAAGVVACLLADSAMLNMDMDGDYFRSSPSRVGSASRPNSPWRTIAPADDY